MEGQRNDEVDHCEGEEHKVMKGYLTNIVIGVMY